MNLAIGTGLDVDGCLSVAKALPAHFTKKAITELIPKDLGTHTFFVAEKGRSIIGFASFFAR